MDDFDWSKATISGPDGKPVGAPEEFDWSKATVTPPRGKLRALADTVGIPLAKGIIGVPEALTGLADIPTGGAVGKAVESAGVRFKDAKAALDEMLSPEQQAINKGLQDTKGFLPTVGYALSNPSTILGSAVESAPSMLGGAAIGRGALAAGRGALARTVGEKAAPIIAGGIGEGAVSAGQNAEQVRQETPSGYLSPQQAAIQAGSGALTGLIGGAGGKLAARMGLTDIDTALIRGSLAPAGKTGIGAAVKRVTGGVVSEGLIEELPQSAQEQIAQNLALGKPWSEGVPEAAAMGALVGGVMGGGANVFAGKPQAPAPIPDQSGAAPSKGATVAPLQPTPIVNQPEAAAVDNPIQRDETGASVHPYDAAALNAALQPNAGPLTKAAGIAAAPIPDGPPTATEQARLDESLQGTMQDTVKQEQQALSELEAADARVQEQRQRETEVQRRAMLDAILEDQDVRDPVGKFAAELKRAGYQGELSVPSKDELGRVKRFRDVQAALEAEHVAAGTPEGLPNEMDVASLVPEKKAAGAPPARAATIKLPDDLIPAAVAAKARKDGPTAFFQAVKRYTKEPQKRTDLMAAFKAFVPEAVKEAERAAASPATPAVQPGAIQSQSRAPEPQSATQPRTTQSPADTAQSSARSPQSAPDIRPLDSPSPTPTVLKTPIVAPKEPWEMTREKAVGQGYTFQKTDRALRMELSKWESIRKDAAGQNYAIDAVEKAIADTQGKIARAASHRAAVEQAIKDGKDVPANVLADYPDLAPPPQPANAVAETPAAKSTESDALKSAHEAIIRGKAQTTAFQRKIIDAAAADAAKIRAGKADLTTKYAKNLRSRADTIAKWDEKAADAVRVLADHVDSTRPKSQMELNRAAKEQAKADKKAANKAAMDARRAEATKAKAPAGSQRIMNVDSVLEVTRNIGGIRYEVFKAASGDELRASLRVTDIDSGNVVSLVQYPSLAEAEAKFNETSRAALKAETPASAPEPTAADAASVSAEDFGKLVDEVFAEPPAPPVPTKAKIIPTRKGVMVQPVDDFGNNVGEPHLAGENPKEEPAPPKPAGEFEKGDRVELIDGQYVGRHGAISEKVALRTVSVFGGGSTSERSVHYHVKTDAGVEVYAGSGQIKAETAKPENVTPDIQMNGMWQDPAAVLRSVEYSRSNANKSRGAAGRARLDQSKKQHLAQAADYDKRAVEAQAAFDAWAAKYPEAAAPLLPKKTALKAPATTAGTADIPAMTMAQQKHGKTGEQLYIVNMNERQERPVFERMRDRAVSMGGYYSNYAGARGFTFKTEEAARKFMGQEAAPDGDAQTVKDFLAGGRGAVLPPTKTGGQILGEASGHAGSAVKAGFAGLDALFGRKGTLGSGPVFDEGTWARAKPHFQAAYAEFAAAGKSLREFVVHIKDEYNDAIIPYLKRWHQDLQEAQNGNPTDTQTTGNDDRAGDGGQRPTDLSEPQVEREPGASDQRAGEDVRNDDESSQQQGVDEVDRGEQLGESGGPSEGDGSGSSAGASGGARRRARIPAQRKPGLPKGISDYHPEPGTITREGGWKKQAGINLDIIELVKRLETENRLATPDEQAILVKWTGWGASELAQNLFVGYQSGDGFQFNSYGVKDDWKALVERAEKLLTPQEAAAAARSTQYAHYTSETVIRGMWDVVARMGFTGGRILEPGMGTGLFPVLGPTKALKNSSYTGIEFEPFTAKIAKYLLPAQNVLNADYTKYQAPPAFFDLVIGNPPFSKTPILTDPEYKKYRFSLHDYMFAKSIDRLRPGGLMAFVTSMHTMDKATDSARAYIAERADLIGAIRLPRTAFHQNAGTEVVTDILFFQRRAPGQEAGGAKWNNLASIEIADGSKEPYLINEYYVAHPEMVLGAHSRTGKMRAADMYTVLPNGELSEQLAEAVARFPKGIMGARPTEKTERKTFERDMDPKAKKEGMLYIGDDGEIYRREFGTGRRLEEVRKMKLADQAWFKGYIGLRDLLKAARFDQLTDGDWKQSLKALNTAYDAFVKKHGNLLDYTEYDSVETDDDGNERTVTERRYKHEARFRVDAEGALVAALEKIDQAGAIKRGPFLLDRVLAKPAPPKIESVQDALAVSLSDVGRLDLARVAELSSKSVDDVIAELGDLIYYSPSGEWQMADEYLSGNVVKKLEEAQAALAVDPAYERNVTALEKAQPKPLAAADITVSLGSSWIPPQYFNQFAEEVLELRRLNVTRNVLGTWSGMDGAGSQSGRRDGQWSTSRRSTVELFDAAMNSRTVKVTDTVDKKTVTNAEATADANEKVKNMRAEFGRWIWRDATRASDLLDLYNHTYNNIADRTFNGEHLQLPGLSLRYTLYGHQKRAIWRAIQTGNTYFAHAVGAGKTLEMIVSAMEQRRLGLIATPMFAVPRHMLNQFAAEFLDAYPAAEVMVASPENFGKENRKRFVAQAAMNKPDAIVISHPAFGLIKPDPEMTKQVLDDLIGELQTAMEELDSRDQKDKRTRKQIEQRIEQLEQRFLSKTSAGDDLVTLEEMGVDFLYVDEAHEFRKLDIVTNRQNLKGVSPEGSRRALDLYIKTKALEKRRPGRSHIFASGTPVTNTMGELYTIQRFMDEATLAADGFSSFDDWATQFGEVVAFDERNAAGGYEVVERFANFVNVPELMSRARSFMDVLTFNQLKDLVKVPDVRGDTPQIVLSDASPSLKEYMKGLDERIKISRKWKPSKEEPGNPDPLINIITDARLASIDMGFVNGGHSNPSSKLNKMIDRIIEIHKRDSKRTYTTEGNPDMIKGGAQIVFSAVGFGEQVAKNRGFDVRGYIERRLAKGGVKPAEIAWMSDYSSPAKKEGMFRAMREGRIRILLGSPKNMGTGVNVQKRLTAEHFLSAPWYPADEEQPRGRIVRQGNQNDVVDVEWYATKETYDSTQWQMIARKQRMIERVMTGSRDVRRVEDISEASQYEQASALASGDERVIRFSRLNRDIESLELLNRAHADAQSRLRNEARWARSSIQSGLAEAAKLEQAIKDGAGEYLSSRDTNGDIMGQHVEAAGELGQAVFNAVARAMKATPPKDDKAPVKIPLGKLNGAEVRAELNMRTHKDEVDFFAAVWLRWGGFNGDVLTNIYPQSDMSPQQITAIGSALLEGHYKVQKDLNRVEQNIDRAREALAEAEKQIGAPFDRMQELVEKVAEAATLRAELLNTNIQPTDAQLEAEADALVAWESEGGRAARETDALANLSDRAQSPTASNLDASLFTIAAQSPSIKPLLEHIILHSKSPLNKVIARALLKSGINPKVRVGNKYAENPANLPKVALHQLSAMYTPTEDGKGEVTLFNMRTAEHDSLHEAAHAATYAAIRKGGMAARQLEALYAHVKKFGTFDPEAYGLDSVHEFIAEAMSNPDFQRELRGIPPIHGMKVRSAWDWFVNIVRNILGLDKTAHNALSQALEIGNALMIEGRGINGGMAESLGASKIGAMRGSFRNLVEALGRDDVNEILSNWNDSELNPAGDKIINYPGRDGQYSKAGLGGKVGVTQREFMDWLASDKVNDGIGPDDAEWNALIQRARAAAGIESLGGRISHTVKGMDGVTFAKEHGNPLTKAYRAIQKAADAGEITPDEYRAQNNTAANAFLDDVAQRFGDPEMAERMFRRLGLNRKSEGFFRDLEVFIRDHIELAIKTGPDRQNFQGAMKRLAASYSVSDTVSSIMRSDFSDEAQTAAKNMMAAMAGAIGYKTGSGRPQLAAPSSFANRAQTFTKAFRDWFGDSKVVDGKGEPLVVYHGTRADFDAFDPATIGQRNSKTSRGFYFTTSTQFAGVYADGTSNAATKWNPQSQWSEPVKGGANLMPVYVSLQNPKIITGDWLSPESALDADAGKIVKQAKTDGYDGLIVRRMKGDEWDQTAVVAFRPEQIKSATGNNGDFDRGNPSILANAAGGNDPTGTFSPYKDAAVNAVRDVFTNNKTFSTANLGMLPGLATSKQKAFVDPENFGPVHNAVQSYLSSVSKYALRAANLAPDVLQQITSVHDAIKALGKLAHRKQTTKDMAALSKALNREREIKHRLTDADPEWDTLTNTQHSLLAQSHDVLDKSMRDLNAASIARTLHGKHMDAAVADMMETGDVGPMLDTLKTRIENTDDPQIKADLQDAYKVSKERTDKIESLITKGYVPHLRFGDWAVDVIDPAGNRRSFNFFESQRQANAAVRAFKAEFPTHEVSVSKVSKESPTLFEGVSPDVLELFVDQLAAKGIVDAKESEAYQEFLKQVVANNSAMKRLIHSKEIPGYDTDIQRVLASFTTANARMASILTHGPSIVQAIGNIDKRTHAESYDEAIKLRDYILNPTEEFAKLRSYLFINYLGGSIASAMTNMTQPVMTTFPRLSEFAGAKAAVYIKDGAKIATGRIFKGMPMPAGELRNAIERGEKEGLLLPQEMHQLYAESIKGLGSGVGARATMQLLGSFFSVSEQFNRELTFVAAFKTAQGMTADQLKAAGLKDGSVVNNAYDFAKMVTEDTQFLYNKGNRPNLSRGLGAPLFVFKMYSIQYLELLKRLPPKQRLLALGLLVLAAGANGLPFSDDLEDLITTLSQSLGYDLNIKQSKRALAYKAFGKTMGDFVLNGASTFTPLDVSQRLGLANLVPGTGMFKQSNTDKADDILEWFGAAGSLARNFTYAISNAQDGRYADAAKAPLPLFMQNIAKGMQMWETGEYRSGAGKKVMDVDKVDAIVKAIGFQPREVADVMRTDREIRETVDLVRNVQSAIMRKIVASVVDNDPEARMEAFAELQQWNRDNPDSKIRILPSSIQQAVRNARMTLQQRTIKQASPSIRGGVAGMMAQ